MTKYWIQKSVKHKGSLRKWAEKHYFIKNGKIDIEKALKYARKNKLTYRIRQLNLAKTLKRLRKNNLF